MYAIRSYYGYNYEGDPAEIVEFYKQTLAEYENFAVAESYDGSEIITCAKDGIEINIYFESFFGRNNFV